MKKLLLIFLSIVLVNYASAQWGQLKEDVLSTSDYEGLIYTGTSLIAASEGGIFRSADNGLTWNISVNGLDTSRIESWDITFIQETKEVWITCSSGVYKSVDDGLNWSRVTLTGLNSNGQIRNITHVGTIIIIIFSDWNESSGSSVYQLCYSVNGTSWSYGATLGPENTSRWRFIANDNNHAAYIIEEFNDNSGKLWYSTDGTDKVAHPTTGLPVSPSMRDRAFTIDPAGTILFFMDENSSKFFRYYPGTTSWVEKMNGIGGTGLTISGVLNLHNLGNHLFGSVIFTNASSEMSLKLFYSSDNGENWTAIADPGITLPIFEDQMVIAGSNRIIGNCFNAHIAYSDNYGQTWTKVNTVFGGEFKSLAGLPNGTIFTTSSDQEQGLLKTTDNGNTWTIQNGDLPNFIGVYTVDALFSSNTTLYATASDNPMDEKLFLYKSTNEGLNWTKITTGPDTKTKIFVGRHGTYPILFFTDDGNTGTYQYTTDEGATWFNISPVITLLGIDRVMGIKSNGTNMILFAEKGEKTKVYLSEDNGTSFSDITFELGGINFEILITNRYEWRVAPSAVAGYKSDGTEFYVAVKDYSSFPWGLDFYKLKPTNDGWTKTGSLGVPIQNDPNWHSLRNIGNIWYLTSSVGTYASIDNTLSWLRVWNNQGFLKGIKASSVLINNNYVLLGTYGTGLWRAPLSAPTLTTLAVSEIQDVSVTGGAAIISTGGLPFSNKGLCWATHTTPTTSDYVLYKGSSWSDFTGTMQPLVSATTYYVRAFVQGPKGIVYSSNEVTFTSGIATGIESESATGNVVVYPNPVKEIMNIRSDSEYYMSFHDITGRNVLNGPIYQGTTSFMVEKMPAGFYFMKLKRADGKVQTIPVVIK